MHQKEIFWNTQPVDKKYGCLQSKAYFGLSRPIGKPQLSLGLGLQFKMDLEAKLIVTFVWGIIAFEASAYLSLYAPLLYQHNPFLFVLILPLFLAIVSILCVSYYKSIYCEPGHPNYHINLHYNEELEQIRQKARRESELKKIWRSQRRKGEFNLDEIKSLNEISYCFKCEVVKEPRVHHCRVCRKCIQRMDHHCPWVGNCVGKLNHKYFILFLFYATAGLLMVAISITEDWLSGEAYASQLSKAQYYTYYFACITSYMLASSIGFLFVTQILSSSQNITTLQSFTEGLSKHNIFDRGSVMSNLREIFGTSSWLLPTNPFPPECPLENGTIDVL